MTIRRGTRVGKHRERLAAVGQVIRLRRIVGLEFVEEAVAALGTSGIETRLRRRYFRIDYGKAIGTRAECSRFQARTLKRQRGMQ
jgi:hypothetical protein